MPDDDTREPWSTLKMRELVTNWLDGRAADDYGLDDWLAGMGLPPVGDEEPPYVWILRGLPAGATRAAYEPKLATHAGLLLDRRPDEDTTPNVDWMFNLLKLCSGLSCPDELQEPLHRLFARRRLRGELDGIELTVALCEALRENQSDDRYRDIWRRMMNGERHEFLEGGVFDGFLGILWMPPTRERRGQPAVGDILDALVAVAFELASDSQRDALLTEVLASVVDAYPSISMWQEHFRHLAQRPDWPSWAQRALLTFRPKLATPELIQLARGEPEAVLPCLEQIACADRSPNALSRAIEELSKHSAETFITRAVDADARLSKKLWEVLPKAGYDFFQKEGTDETGVRFNKRTLVLAIEVAEHRWLLDARIQQKRGRFPESQPGRQKMWQSQLKAGARR